MLDADPDRVEVHNTLGYMALGQGHYEDAVASFKRYAYFAGESANPHDSLGEAYIWTGRYHESVEQYQIALEIDPSFLSSVMGATDALAVTGQFRIARKFLDNFEELFERRNQYAYARGQTPPGRLPGRRMGRVVASAERLRADDSFKNFQPGLRLWTNTLGAIGHGRTGTRREAEALIEECRNALRPVPHARRCRRTWRCARTCNCCAPR